MLSFSWTNCLTKAEEPNLSYYLPIAGGRIIGFPNGISAMWNAVSLVQDLNSCRRVAYSYADACRNIFDTIKTSGHSSLEKYTSHFIERVVCERELVTEQNSNILTPPVPPAIAVRLFRSPGLLNRGFGGPASLLRAGSHSSIWNTDFKIWTPTAWLPVSPGLYHCFTSTQFNPSTVKVIPWSLRPDSLVI